MPRLQTADGVRVFPPARADWLAELPYALFINVEMKARTVSFLFLYRASAFFDPLLVRVDTPQYEMPRLQTADGERVFPPARADWLAELPYALLIVAVFGAIIAAMVCWSSASDTINKGLDLNVL